MPSRSPFFYVGDKYKLITQLKQYFPTKIRTFIEPFVGGGSGFLNVTAENYIVNDIDSQIIGLHTHFSNYKDRSTQLFLELFELIDKFNLSCSLRNRTVSEDLKVKFKKTYFARHNSSGYKVMKDEFNRSSTKNLNILYLLLIYGFNHMIRFNKKGEFNLPVGNVDFNKNVHSALNAYLDFMSRNSIEFYSNDYEKFLDTLCLDSEDFIYLDPPYLIGFSEYNKLWNESDEERLYKYLDGLNEKGIRFGLSNLLVHKNKENKILENWMCKYQVYYVQSNYISRFDNSIKLDSKEVYVTNYEKA